ncbi:MAG: hypothetical protein LBV12_07745 [Puniceicoccales bacterium]|jgi:hypothetical protein|nr:hypothetical protein [Puniceicoccales bacterium]
MPRSPRHKIILSLALLGLIIIGVTSYEVNKPKEGILLDLPNAYMAEPSYLQNAHVE